MEPKKVTVKDLDSIIGELIKGGDDSRGTYLYRGFRLQISKYKATGAERTSRLYHKRRDEGLCIRCGKKVGKKNPKTGKLYRLCDYHRNAIDKKTASTSRKAKKKSASKSKAKSRVKAKAKSRVKSKARPKAKSRAKARTKSKSRSRKR
ncbi:MAG: hypothetical protein JW969_07590 [Spirochaetales bacterium]|nr:hypothetical protein [Spirochaetales bacterium]